MIKRRYFAFLAVVLLAAALAPLSEGASANTSGIVLLIESVPTEWESIAVLATALIIMVAGMVFALASLINSPTARTWSRMQIYEALLSLAMLIIFSFFAYLMLVNPKVAFGAVDLVPPSCSVSSVSNIFTLATCDLSAFNNDAFGLAETLYSSTYFLGFTPGFKISLTPIPGQPYIGVSAGLPSVLSGSIETSLSTMFNAILFMLVLNQVQLLIISGSMLFLFVFFVIGIIARTFGFSKSFGGVMIAFAIGLGIVYPLLVSMTYGFIAYQLSIYTIAGDLGNALVSLIFPGVLVAPSVWAVLITSAGYIVAGLTFIPFLNFLILDAFIVDFSSSIGERVSFMSLLSGLV